MLNTVNVIQYYNDSILSVYSFEDNPEGNQRAEESFKALANQNKFGVIDIEIGLSEGILENDCGYQIFIVHSEKIS